MFSIFHGKTNCKWPFYRRLDPWDITITFCTITFCTPRAGCWMWWKHETSIELDDFGVATILGKSEAQLILVIMQWSTSESPCKKGHPSHPSFLTSTVFLCSELWRNQLLKWTHWFFWFYSCFWRMKKTRTGPNNLSWQIVIGVNFKLWPTFVGMLGASRCLEPPRAQPI